MERVLRSGLLSSGNYAGGLQRLTGLRRGWRQIEPSEALRAEAEFLLTRYSLRAADALQLAAAMIWSRGNPRGKAFICFDAQLLFAAQQLGFKTLSV
ncbi:hypothetical protein ACFPT7_04020 [Acidicapsa dinghuensis]|uniref:PIN domain-containing protein n=1 Tax=Acidicapsa dinghuensis TaxID=2218256 RepID=A0ABW1EDS9_9BACT|nr:hypothetical protein [Acidicapsa dinghuensis]